MQVMNEHLMKMDSKIFNVTACLFVGSVFLWLIIFGSTGKEALVKRSKIINAYVYAFNPGYKGGLELEYYFFIKGKKYSSGKKYMSIGFRDGSQFYWKYFPLLYDT